MLRAAGEATTGLDLSQFLDIARTAGPTGMLVIGFWAFFTDRIYTRKQYEQMRAERDAERANVKALTDVTMTEVMPLVTRMTDVMREIEPRIDTTFTVRQPGKPER
jgi:hypothetical protein